MPEPAPFAPGCRLWDDMGDTLFASLSAGAFLLQVMHPTVAAGVEQHSVFREDPLGRAIRSFDSVMLWVYGGAAALEEGRRLRRLHAAIRGGDGRGRPYTALDPEAYAWVHATAFVTAVNVHPLVRGRALTPREQAELYDEILQLGEILQVPRRHMPQTPADYWDYYHAMVSERLEPTPAAETLLAIIRRPPLPLGPLSSSGSRLAGRLLELLSIGGMTGDARARLGVSWTSLHEAQLRSLMAVARPIHARLPEALRYFPLAAHARRHARELAAIRRRATAGVGERSSPARAA